MRKFNVRLIAAMLSVGSLSVYPPTATAAGRDDMAAPAPKESPLAKALARDTGVAWTVEVDPRSGEVSFLAPETAVSVGKGTPEAMARAFFRRYAAHSHASPREELRVQRAETDPGDGSHYVRFQHFIAGTNIRIDGSVSMATFTSDGKLVWSHAGFRADIARLSTRPAVARSVAISKAEGIAMRNCELASKEGLSSRAALAVMANPEHPAALMWQVTVASKDGRCGEILASIDASTGRELDLHDGAVVD